MSWKDMLKALFCIGLVVCIVSLGAVLAELEQEAICKACEAQNWTGVVKGGCTFLVCDSGVVECGKLRAYGLCKINDIRYGLKG